MKLQQNIQPHNSNIITGTDSSKYPILIDKIFTCVNDHLLMLMNQMLVTADEKLKKKAGKAKTEEERKKFLDCTQVFRTESNDINHHFFMNLNKSLVLSQTNTANCDEDKSTLVDQDEMDEMVAITTMHSKAMNIYGDEVNHLEARLEYLEIMCQKIFDKEALQPKHICEVFQTTIENIDLAIEVKLIFYKLFDQEVCSKLGVLYKALNQLFINNNIMPEIVLKTMNSIEVEYIEDEVSSRVATYYDAEENKQTNFVPRTKQDISRIVNEFMSGEMTITGDEIELPESFLRTPTQQDLNGKNCYQRKEVLRALSNLQRKLTSLHHKSKSLTTRQIKQELLDDIEKTNDGALNKQVNLLDERSIDFVGLMFDAIADDETVSAIMTNLIKRLQIPVMKVAMTDSKLFDQEEHPARVTVDLLTTAGKGINNEDDRLYKSLVAVIDNLLNQFEDDLSVFEQAAKQIKNIILKEKQLTDKTEKQQQQQILLKHARHIVLTQLRMISCNRKIPDQLRPLVLKNWASLMLNRYIRHGRGSPPWLQSVLLLKLLFKCMQSIHFQSQYNLVKNNHMALVEAVNDELYETQQNKNEITEQIVALKTHLLNLICHYDLKIINETDKNQIEAEPLDYSSENSEEELQQIQQQIQIAEQKIAQLSSSTKPGAWYEIYTGKEKAVRRLKLSVILNDAAQLIFVDRRGIKIIEKDAEEFAKELKENRSRLLDDHSTFDFALGKIIGTIAA